MGSFEGDRVFFLSVKVIRKRDLVVWVRVWKKKGIGFFLEIEIGEKYTSDTAIIGPWSSLATSKLILL